MACLSWTQTQATLALAQYYPKSKGGGGGAGKVIAFHSKSLRKSGRNYCVTRKELLAVIVAVRTYHHYLCGGQFLIRTDHRALKWLLKFKNPDDPSKKVVTRTGPNMSTACRPDWIEFMRLPVKI